MSTDAPEFVQRLKRIRSSLEHARRFGFDTIGNYRSACVQAEGNIEELLIDYGFQRSDERDPDPRVTVHVEHAPGLYRTTHITEELR